MKRMRRALHIVISLVVLLTTLNVFTVGAQEPPPYLDPNLSIEERVEDLLARMSLAEKIGQMTLIEKNSISPEDVTAYFIGGLLSGGGGYPQPNTPEAWAEMVADFQNAALATPLGIPMIYGVDAVHGHNNVRGAVIFPHNIGLGATRDANLVQQIGVVTAQEMIATNIYWNYAPVIAVPQDIRWGRTYEGFGENTDLVTELGTAYLLGLQGDDLAAAETVLGTPKHYIGDGGAAWGTSPFGSNNIDRGVTEVDEATLRTLYLPPYQAAIEAGARNIMISFSSWGGLPMHAQAYLINDVLKGELAFTGFTVSDWAGIDAVADDYYDAVVISINAGLDMIMVPQDTEGFIDALTRAAQAGDVPMERINDAVRRILRVKFELGLFERPLSDGAQLAEVGSEAHRALARQAVQESLVLLKNEDATLPLAHDVGTVFIAGMSADDIGAQSGGWTIEWQGGTGDITPGTSLRAAIEAAVSPDTAVYFDRLGRFRNATDADGNPLRADVGIVVIGEQPYAEYEGDSATLELPAGAVQTIERIRERADRVVVILLSGRPLIVTDALNPADAFVAAWLPGTEGAGVADVLFGDVPFTGQLSYTWPRTIDQLPFDFAVLPTEGCDAPLFPYGYGLTADSPDATWTDLAKSCAGYVDPLTVAEQAAPEIAATPAPVAGTGGGPLAPDGEYGETYYAPFPVAITLDGDFSDWAGVPTVTLPDGADLTSGAPAVTFAATADDTYLYLRGDVIDSNIISGEHEADYWNEDSVEFYLNATGDPGLTSYTDGVAQITLPALNAGQPPEDAVIAGMQGPSAEAEVVTVLTDTGWAVEVAVPLHNAVWDIIPAEGAEIGFQVHLNGASTAGRDTKLIWSIYDTSDQSYLNPSVFGTLIFTEAQVASAAACDCPPQGFVSALGPDGLLDDFEHGIWLGTDASNTGIGFAPWGDVAENLNLSVRQLVPLSELGIPGKDEANNVLAAAYDITGWGGFTHAFTDGENWISLDWSAYNAVSFWLYGNETGGVVQMDIFDNRAEGSTGDSAERWAYRLDDDFSGWRYVTIPFDLFTRRTDWQPSGAPNDGLGLDQVSGYAFGFPVGAGPQIAYLDDVRLVTVDDTSAVTISETASGEVASAEPEPFVVDESITWDSREWTLVWSDEFEGDAGTSIDAESWTCEIGGEGWGNNELEYYTQSPSNVSLDGDGNLAIVAREENPANYSCHYGTCTHTSARCITQGKVEFTYGRVEARLKLPYGQGIWPAFWMLGANFAEAGWPASGEIDIMENVGFEPMTVHGTIHGPGYSGGSGIGGGTDLAAPLSDDFHVYAIDWDPNVIRWYVDGALYLTTSINDVGRREWVFDHDFFLLLNVAVGGYWPGYPDETTVFPQTMLVDYVRVYQLAE